YQRGAGNGLGDACRVGSTGAATSSSPPTTRVGERSVSIGVGSRTASAIASQQPAGGMSGRQTSPMPDIFRGTTAATPSTTTIYHESRRQEPAAAPMRLQLGALTPIKSNPIKRDNVSKIETQGGLSLWMGR